MIPHSLKKRSAFFVSLHFFVPKICIFKSILLCSGKFFFYPGHNHIHKIILLHLAELAAWLPLMPFSDAFTTAGCSRVLSDKHRMSLHWGLFSVIRDNCRSFSLCNKILCVLPDHVKSLFINVINIFLFQMKTAPEPRCLKMLEELFIPFFFCHWIHFPVNNDPTLLLYLFLILNR